ncbi:MAG: hypothetical protein LM573_08085 [Thermofilum sp.]|jgi:hypothetical protein|nr:hypothetical protein [Thermofilum sp.]
MRKDPKTTLGTYSRKFELEKCLEDRIGMIKKKLVFTKHAREAIVKRELDAESILNAISSSS